MSDQIDYEYFDREPITLFFGYDQKCLYINEAILRKFPFFSDGSKYDVSGIDQSRRIDLLGYNGKVVANVINYSITNLVPEILRSGISDDMATQLSISYAQAWIVANKFGVEKIANMLVDRLVQYHDRRYVNTTLLKLLKDAEYEDTSLYGHLLSDVAYCL